ERNNPPGMPRTVVPSAALLDGHVPSLHGCSPEVGRSRSTNMNTKLQDSEGRPIVELEGFKLTTRLADGVAVLQLDWRYFEDAPTQYKGSTQQIAFTPEQCVKLAGALQQRMLELKGIPKVTHFRH